MKWACLCLGLVLFLKLSKSQAYFNNGPLKVTHLAQEFLQSPSLCLHLQRVQKRRKATIELVHENLPKTCLTFTPPTMRKPRNFPERTDPLKAESIKQSDMSSQWPSRGCTVVLGSQLCTGKQLQTGQSQSFCGAACGYGSKCRSMGSTHLGI